jgi:hypothetical protein
MALALDGALKWHAMPFPVPHPVLKHEGSRRSIADRAAVRTAVRERINAIVRVQRLFQKI